MLTRLVDNGCCTFQLHLAVTPIWVGTARSESDHTDGTLVVFSMRVKTHKLSPIRSKLHTPQQHTPMQSSIDYHRVPLDPNSSTSARCKFTRLALDV